MKLYDIISNLKFIGIKNYQDMDIDSLTCDSKERLNNGLYFCIKGTKIDGHDFADESIKNGAICLVVDHFLDIPIAQIMVENVRSTMSYISSIFFATDKIENMKFIGITGTNGKTTTTFIIREILTQMNKGVGMIGTEGVYIKNLMLPPALTTPDPIFLHKLISDMHENGCEYCVMEVSAHAIALNKIDDIKYDIVGISNITNDHLDFFINMENYIKCKASLFDSKHAKMGVVNIDDKFSKDIVKKSNIDIQTYGKDGDFKIIEINQQTTSTEFKFFHKNHEYKCVTNLIGEYNIHNLLMAIACLNSVGFEIKEILKIIKTTKIVVPGRFNILKLEANFDVLIDYAHTPDGMKNVLSSVKKLPVERIITVFGCGGDRDRSKRNMMGKIAVDYSDITIVTSDNPRCENPDIIIDDIVKGIENKNVIRICDRRSAIEYALSIAKSKDIILILGKGAENYQEIGNIKIPYSDYDTVDNYFKYKEKDIIKA